MVTQRTHDRQYGFSKAEKPRFTAEPPAHNWVEDYCMGRLHVCTRCPAVWWPHLAPPKETCVPVSADSTAPTGDVA